MIKYLSFISALLFTCQAYSQTITIQKPARQVLERRVTVHGIVTTGAELGTIRYFQDETGGLAAYSASLVGNLNRWR